jgi:tetratricopeptide (TPR) repeat protein
VEVTSAQQLLDLLGRKPNDLELDVAALEISRIEYPDLDPAQYLHLLDRHAFEIAIRADDLSDGRNFVETANAYLFGQPGVDLGLRGNNNNYYSAENSCLNRVLDTGLGIPITLSLIYMEVGRRLAKPVHGIALPGHFIIQYNDGDYATFVDPFHGGVLIDLDGCRALARVDTLTDEMLAHVDRRTIIMRMVNNLRNVYFSTKATDKALRLLDLLLAADPEAADEHKQRGVALMHLRRIPEAVAAFRRYLDLRPDAPDKETIQDQLRSLGHWLASRN